MSERQAQEAGHPEIDMARRIDAVCRRFEADWRDGRRARVDDYLGDVPDEGRAALLAELEALERELRRPDENLATCSGRRRSPRRRPSRLRTRRRPRSRAWRPSSVHEEATVAPRDEPRSTSDRPRRRRPMPPTGPHPLFRRLRDRPRAGPRRHGRRLPGAAGQPQPAGRAQDDPRRPARQRDRRQALLHRGRGGGQPRPSGHRADLRGGPARGPALLLHGLRRGPEPFAAAGRWAAAAPRGRAR